MNQSPFQFQYAFDKGLNLLQRTAATGQSRMIVAAGSNRAVNAQLYASLNLSQLQYADLNEAWVSTEVFDQGGNQLKSVANDSLSWDYRSMLQYTGTRLKGQHGEVLGSLNEYSLYAKTGRRNRKVTEKTDTSGNTVEVQEALYLGNLEYRSTWTGSNLVYDGERVYQNDNPLSPWEAYVALRIRQGHKQVSEKRVYTYKEGNPVSEVASFFSLDNNIDSCELQLNDQGQLESYYASKPYGETAVSHGSAKQHPYKYSGQEKDQSGLYYYGYRSLLPQNFRWMSVDPAGIQGSGLNWYAMVQGNPVTMRDNLGLITPEEAELVLSHWNRTSGGNAVQSEVLEIILLFAETIVEIEKLMSTSRTLKDIRQMNFSYVSKIYVDPRLKKRQANMGVKKLEKAYNTAFKAVSSTIRELNQNNKGHHHNPHDLRSDYQFAFQRKNARRVPRSLVDEFEGISTVIAQMGIDDENKLFLFDSREPGHQGRTYRFGISIDANMVKEASDYEIAHVLIHEAVHMYHNSDNDSLVQIDQWHNKHIGLANKNNKIKKDDIQVSHLFEFETRYYRTGDMPRTLEEWGVMPKSQYFDDRYREYLSQFNLWNADSYAALAITRHIKKKR